MKNKNIGRNEHCHCGSGRKYKKCCLIKDENSRFADVDADLELGQKLIKEFENQNAKKYE